MNNTIEVIDKDTNTKQTYVLREKPEKKEIDLTIPKTVLKLIFKSIIKLLKFSIYIVISLLEVFIRLIKVLFNLNDYKPLQGVTDSKNSFLTRIAKKEINKEKIRFVSDYLGRHEYIFPRSDNFLNCYKEIQQRLKNISDNNIELSYELYHDTMKRISILVTEAEKQALREGYSYARETKYKLDTSTVYDEFIQDRVMQGESNRKYQNNKEEGE